MTQAKQRHDPGNGQPSRDDKNPSGRRNGSESGSGRDGHKKAATGGGP